jgi:hypothetical protein
MIIAGAARGGILVALAYKNLTTGAKGSQGWFLWLFITVLFGGVGIAIIIGFVDVRVQTVGQIIGVGIFGGVFCAFGALSLFSGSRTLQALYELHKEAP